MFGIPHFLQMFQISRDGEILLFARSEENYILRNFRRLHSVFQDTKHQIRMFPRVLRVDKKMKSLQQLQHLLL